MKKYLLATVLALGMLGVEQSQVRADGCCLSLGGCWRIKICGACKFNCSTEPFSCCPPCGGGGGGGGYGGYGGGCAYDNCGGPVPGAGPWYAYWPSAGGNMIAGGGGYPGWTYSDYFSAPAPTGYPYWPAPMMAPGPHGPAGGLQPVGHYPSYWYGH